MQKAPLKKNCKMNSAIIHYRLGGCARADPGPGAGVPEAEGGGDDQPAHCGVPVPRHLDTACTNFMVFISWHLLSFGFFL